MTVTEQERVSGRAPRVAIYATVEIRGGVEILILPVQNLSLSGVLLAADEEDHGLLPVGRACQVAVSAPGHRRIAIEMAARVVRHEPGGIALTWGAASDAPSALRRLLEATPAPR